MRRRRGALTGRKATVCVERNGASIRVDDVNAVDAAAVLADMLMAFRRLTEEFPELVIDLGSVPGGAPLQYEDDWSWDQDRKRVGFK